MKNRLFIAMTCAFLWPFIPTPAQAHHTSVVKYSAGAYHAGHGRHDRYHHRKHYKKHRRHHRYHARRAKRHYVYSAPVVHRVRYTQSARYCREYNTVILVGGRRVPSYGRACRQPDGSWQIVK